jgi:chromate transporter
MHANRKLTGALAAVTAAVVGVIANLALWFGLRVLFAEVREVGIGPVGIDLPVLATVDPGAAAIAIIAAVCLFRFRLGVVSTLGVATAAGLLLHLATGRL